MKGTILINGVEIHVEDAEHVTSAQIVDAINASGAASAHVQTAEEHAAIKAAHEKRAAESAVERAEIDRLRAVAGALAHRIAVAIGHHERARRRVADSGAAAMGYQIADSIPLHVTTEEANELIKGLDALERIWLEDWSDE